MPLSGRLTLSKLSFSLSTILTLNLKSMTKTDIPLSKSIMLVEDDQIVAELLNHLLNKKGFIVQTVKNGRQAIEQLNSENLPDLILLDIMLPLIDGFQVLSQIRSRKEWEKIPTIMLTGKAQDFNIDRAFAGGANDYLTKPFKPNDLMEKINRLIK